MATNKRRKLDITPSPQPAAMSAFALRKRLLAGQTTSSPAPLPEAPGTDGTAQTTQNQSEDTPSPRKSRRLRLARGPSNQEDSTAPVSGAQPQPTHTPEKGLLSEPPAALPTEPVRVRTKSNDETPIEPPPILFSNFKPSKSNYQKRKDGRLHLKLVDGERLVILGSYGIQVTSGEVTVNGATLGKSKKIYWVDAPYCHALPVVRCPEKAALDLHSHPRASTLRELGRLSPYFRRLWNDTPEPSDSTFKILYTSEDGPKRALLQDLVSPAEWNKEIARLVSSSTSKPVSVMVTGPKSSGKSTFGKLLANRLITHSFAGSNTDRRTSSSSVAVLDLDPGQPEYGVPGQISLVRLTEPVLQPSFCHPLSGAAAGFEVIRSHSLASISPASDPDLYLEAAQDLATHYRNILGTCSLIINTPGWIQGTGLDLLTSLIGDFRPTEVVYMSQTGPAEAVEALQEACRATTFSCLPSQGAQITSRTAAQLRAMQTMSYFHAEADVDSDDDSDSDCGLIKWNTDPLTTIPPWIVSYAGANRGIFGILLYDYQAAPELLADAINGTVLAAVEVESPLAFRDLADPQTRGAGGEGRNVPLEEEDANARMDLDDDNDDDDKAAAAPLRHHLSLQEQLTMATPVEGLPLVSAAHGHATTTLDPRHSRFVGLVLVRGIDARTRTLQLLTPVPAATIEAVSARGGEIVLVSGKLDPASWAYTEDLYYQRGGGGGASTGRQAGDTNDDSGLEGMVDGDGDDEPMEGVEDDNNTESEGSGSGSEGEEGGESELGAGATAPLPWIEVLHGNQKRGVGSKVWRVRRDLGRMGTAAE
ncbi:Polynucleotide 5'-hydroxyl-kinase grc3 [Diatrype stigma]|uniref:Polynucleotide 5'-hydroxyl-kinase GRC3 n=1 Tax=Diatrype stigma TaxID=117547 RepID=A0AAN9UUL7_9PEZI